MSLVWHLAKKDLRRMSVPVVVWLVSLGLPALWLSLLHVPNETVSADGTEPWCNIVSALLATLTFMQLTASVLLAGFLVLEDPVVGTTTLWLTRPIAGWRLMVAKLLSATLLLAIAPVAILLPAWLATGFTLRDCASTAAEAMLMQGGLILGGLALATLAESLVHYVTVSLCFIVTFGIGLSRLPAHWLGVEAAYNGTPEFFMSVVVLPPLAIVLAMQYLTRTARQSWTILSLALVAAVAARIYWPVEREIHSLAVERPRWELPARAGAEAAGGGIVLRVVGFANGEHGEVSALLVEDRRRGPLFQLQQRSGHRSYFFIREKPTGLARPLQAHPMRELVQNGIMLRVWRLVPEDQGEWPANGILAMVNGTGTDMAP